MKTHASRGRKIIDDLLDNYNLGEIQHIKMLRNIVELHHEAMNGSGYSLGLRSEEIPIEARIAAVADVFDAITSPRTYKKSWRNDEAFDMLQKLAGIKFDRRCVEALVKNRQGVEEIQRLFTEEK